MAESTGIAEQDIRSELGSTGGWADGALNAVEANDKVKELTDKVENDTLTGLHGEYPLTDMLSGLQDSWEDSIKRGDKQRGTFIILDMDKVHEINRAYGETEGGDDYFRGVAKALILASRSYHGRCFRGGAKSDRFVLYLPGLRLDDEINIILDGIDASLDRTEDEMQEKYDGIKLGLSYSTSSYGNSNSPKDAYRDANNGLSEAKRLKELGEEGRFFVNHTKRENLNNE